MPTDTKQRTPNIKPRTRKCGDPYEHEIPKPEGLGPWEALLQPFFEWDGRQCREWKEEVENLLIYASIFSGVVTTFVVIAHQNLTQDASAAVVISLLTRIADRLDSPTQPPSAPLPISTFTASASAVRIGIFWFLSLALSLSTVLVGIVALQWIREYQRYQDVYDDFIPTPRVQVSTYHMRAEALRRWFVPQIFRCLPLILQAALVLFFIGIIDFVWTLHRTVAICVTALIGLTFFFLIATTILPTLQYLLVAFRDPDTSADPLNMPAPCPYKSPPAWAFYFIVRFLFQQAYSLWDLAHWRSVGGHIPRPSSWLWRIRYLSLNYFMYGSPQSWSAVDMLWLSIRDARSQWSHQRFRPSPDCPIADPSAPRYDEAQFLGEIMQKYRYNTDIVKAAYHCFEDVSRIALSLKRYHQPTAGVQNLGTQTRNHLLHQQYWARRGSDAALSSLTSYIPNPTPEAMHDENVILFCRLAMFSHYPDSLQPTIEAHISELGSRLSTYIEEQGGSSGQYINHLEHARPQNNGRTRFEEINGTVEIEPTSGEAQIGPGDTGRARRDNQGQIYDSGSDERV
ncbi:hypothetical protein BDZ97DRAFT_1825225 [Flammula alnicola]|nr:hypothetical protein BDZ97DRAFT_1825225 [Flammula alnicola]